MLRLVLQRILTTIPVLFVVILLTFILIRLAPGGPFDAERSVPAAVLENLNKRYKLDDPIYVQFWDYLKNVVQGDFGPSFKYPGRTVTEVISAGMPITLELSLYAFIVAIFLGLSAGIFAALRPNTWRDYAPMSLAMIGICLPSFVLGPLLILVFGIELGWLPVSGWGVSPGDKILPALTLGAGYAAYLARLSRGGMIETLSQDYIRTARAKGLSESRIVVRHALRSALAPVVSFSGPAIAGLLSGSFVVESIFQIPGLGRFYLQAAFNRDYTMILGMTIFFAFLIILCNLIADLLLAWLNPKLRSQSAGARV